MKVTKVSAKIKFELESVNECVAFIDLLKSANPGERGDAANLKATLLTIIKSANGRS